MRNSRLGPYSLGRHWGRSGHLRRHNFDVYTYEWYDWRWRIYTT